MCDSPAAGTTLPPDGVFDESVQNHAGKLAINWNGSPEEALTPSIRPDLFCFANRNFNISSNLFVVQLSLGNITKM